MLFAHKYRSIVGAARQKWRSTKRKPLLLLVLALLVIFVSYFSLHAWGFGSLLRPILLAVAAILFALAAIQLNTGVWIPAGIIALAGLLIPTAMLNDLAPEPGRPLETLLWFVLLILPPLALFIAAMLLNAALKLFQEWREIAKTGHPVVEGFYSKHAGKFAVFALILSLLLVAKTLYNLYWLVYWDNTTDAISFFWLVLPVGAAVLAGLMLATILPRWSLLAGIFYAAAIPALIIAVCRPAINLDIRQITMDHAQQVSQLIETYYAREGSYPTDLRQLVPRYTLSIPGPFILYGQDWCYDGGPDYYRLGYVYRQHWSSPFIFGLTYKTKGELPNLGGICDAEVAAIRKAWER